MIDRTAKQPLTIGITEEVLSAAGRAVSYSHLKTRYGWNGENCTDVAFVLDVVRQEMRALCTDRTTRFEHRFLDLFFGHFIDEARRCMKWVHESSNRILEKKSRRALQCFITHSADLVLLPRPARTNDIRS